MSTDRITRLRAGKVQAGWDHAAAEVDLHRHRYATMLAVFVTAVVTSLASIAVDQVSTGAGLTVATLALGAAAYVLAQFRALRVRLEVAAAARHEALDRLLSLEVE